MCGAWAIGTVNVPLPMCGAQVIGTEARALSNIGAADGWTFWSPNLNIYREWRTLGVLC